MSVTHERSARVSRLEERVKWLEKRLETDPQHGYDGISSRDVTIESLEKVAAVQKSQIETLKREVSRANRVGQLEIKSLILDMVQGAVTRDPTLQKLVSAIEEL